MNVRSGRRPDELRAIRLETGIQDYPLGSVLVHFGRTRVLCSASVENRVPPFLRDSGEGWVTAEYAMLPGATQTRNQREAVRGRQQGRTVEIQRLIGRSLRAVVDRTRLGERTITLDCDVIQADGGTRTAAVTGAWVAMALAIRNLLATGELRSDPLKDSVAAVSVGLVSGEVLLDLEYAEDVQAEVDMNVVGTGSGQLVEVQGTAEGNPFSRTQMDQMLDMAQAGIREITRLQLQAIE